MKFTILYTVKRKYFYIFITVLQIAFVIAAFFTVLSICLQLIAVCRDKMNGLCINVFVCRDEMKGQCMKGVNFLAPLKFVTTLWGCITWSWVLWMRVLIGPSRELKYKIQRKYLSTWAANWFKSLNSYELSIFITFFLQ